MANWDKFLDQAPKIIAEAAKSPLGIVALIILALSTLGLAFFADSPDEVKIGIFLVLVLSFGLFGFAAMRRMSERQKEVEATERPREQPTTSPPTVSEAEALPRDVRELLEVEKRPASPRDKVSIAKLPITGEFLFGRDDELSRLDEAWADDQTNVISLVAWGGVGKSALVNHWLGSLAQDNYRSAARVYGVSLYREGTSGAAASADVAIDEALRWFGDPDSKKGSPEEKGERLARLVRQESTLLVLDGIEPLQNPPGPDGGKLKDPGMQSLVRELAASNPGLCVITTRYRVADIEHLSATTAPFIELESLSDAAGVALLAKLGVEGTDEDLRQASRDFAGHSLALNLLGTYLRDVCGGDVRRRSEVRLLVSDAEQGGHAKRVMESYENWFGEGPELSVLRILGLFDRPADSKAVAAAREPPSIPELTDALQDLTDVKWRQTLAKLRRAGLVAHAEPNDPNTLDAHPLVREHFSQQLREEHPDAWKEGYYRLYEHYKQVAPELPDTLEEMTPLFAAVAHGCAAGRHQETLDAVYLPRIQRGSAFFSRRELGAIGAELTVLAGFFDPPWREPVAEFTGQYRGFVLSEAGVGLRALGRLSEAAEPMRAALEVAIADEDWANSAAGASNLSELYLTIGDLTQAVEYGEQSFKLAEKSRDIFQQITKRTTWADALHQAGQMERADALFREAETMQKESQPAFPILYSLWGFRYCDLLLGQGRHQEVQERANQTLKREQQRGHRLLNIALDHLSLGHAHLAEAQEQGTGDFSKAAEHLDRAVDGLRQAGTQHRIPSGFLARSALRRLQGDFDQAHRNLDAAMSIAERGGMGLHQADAHMEYARLYLAMGINTSEPMKSPS